MIQLRDQAPQTASVQVGSDQLNVTMPLKKATLARASLICDFARDEYFLGGAAGVTDKLPFGDVLTFTRGSTATYFGADGVMRTAAVDEPRLDHDPATGEALGLLIEEPRTNKVLQAGDFTKSPWAAAVAGTSTVINAGSASGFPVATVSATSNGGGIRQSVTGLSNGQAHTVTFYVASTAANLTLILENGSNSYGTYCSVTINAATGETSAVNGFTSVTSTTLGAGRLYVAILPPAGGALIANLEWRLGASGETMTFGRPQLEEGAFPTSYIPTAGAAVTRASDLCKHTMVASERNPNEGSVYTHLNTSPDWVARSRHAVVSSYPNRLFLYSNVGNSSAFYYDGSAAGSYGVFADNTDYKAGLAFSKTQGARSFYGGQLRNATGAVQDLSDALNFTFGSSTVGSAFLCSHIKAFAYFPTFLDDASLQELTA